MRFVQRRVPASHKQALQSPSKQVRMLTLHESEPVEAVRFAAMGRICDLMNVESSWFSC
jgi:hypothetical protein